MNLIPISRSLKAALAGLIAATSVLGTLTLQTALYRSITGIAVPAHDNYFYAIVLFLEDVVSLCIIFLVALGIRKKNVDDSNLAG